MADYSKYTGPSDEWIALEKTLPPAPNDLDIHTLKELVNRGREAAAAKDMIDEGLQSQVVRQDYTIPTRDGSQLEARSYRPANVPASQPLPIYLYFHGGGFVFGTVASEDAICSRIVLALRQQDTPVMVVNVNYRHTPEHKYPVAWNDSEDAFHWIHEHQAELAGDGANVVVGGISAGAWLTASLSLKQNLGKDRGLSQRPKIKGQVLGIPPLVTEACYAPQLSRLKDPELSSRVDNATAPILPVSRMKLLIEMLGPPEDETDVRLNPGNAVAAQVKGLPPATFAIAGHDPLRDEGLFYAELLAENGVPTNVHVFPGLPHDFRRYDALSECQRWDAVMANGVKWALSNPAPTVFQIQSS
ncbi:alpha/beta hydrolase [Aspergillus clavatus NRRL 1]|uniref:Lipase/esterase, putative n=1 Tax=Aspergillus clavatus (strain ATCC 1007 / CBS 513.65 / DSM 816 / NCTC 3887 / NRRL 1 / QM 1276 / 107) TaxID=344612 RepID=A1CLI0_ASPCL|nr:lipase/esterase, putative [Aspergillus clavatus NRRL 1]EAW10004.1 lipase/esterase, putative [Aspergillus clavatus NRRL 1]